MLHTCVHMARLGALRTLIQAGADVDAVAADGISVVQVSLQCRCISLMLAKACTAFGLYGCRAVCCAVLGHHWHEESSSCKAGNKPAGCRLPPG